MKLRILRWRDYPALSRQALNVSLEEGGRGRVHDVRGEGDVKAEKDAGRHHVPRNAALEAGKGKETDSPLQPL